MCGVNWVRSTALVRAHQSLAALGGGCVIPSGILSCPSHHPPPHPAHIHHHLPGIGVRNRRDNRHLHHVPTPSHPPTPASGLPGFSQRLVATARLWSQSHVANVATQHRSTDPHPHPRPHTHTHAHTPTRTIAHRNSSTPTNMAVAAAAAAAVATAAEVGAMLWPPAWFRASLFVCPARSLLSC